MRLIENKKSAFRFYRFVPIAMYKALIAKLKTPRP